MILLIVDKSFRSIPIPNTSWALFELCYSSSRCRVISLDHHSEIEFDMIRQFQFGCVWWTFGTVLDRIVNWTVKQIHVCLSLFGRATRRSEGLPGQKNWSNASLPRPGIGPSMNSVQYWSEVAWCSAHKTARRYWAKSAVDLDMCLCKVVCGSELRSCAASAAAAAAPLYA